MLTDTEIAAIIGAEERQAIGHMGDGSKIQQNRATLLDYYNQRPFGDEQEGLSQVVTSDVSDIVEGMLPQLVRIFTQGRHIAKFTSNNPQADEQAEQKTELCNWIFNQQHDGTIILHDMFKDALLQYNGVVKVYWDDSEDTESDEAKGLSEVEYLAYKQAPNFRIKKTKQKDGFYDIEGEWINSTGRVAVENIPPDELLLAKRARDFVDPPFIGQRTPKTRSQLIQMGFDKKLVKGLSKDAEISDEVEIARNHELEENFTDNPTNDPSKDIINLGEYYVKMDADGDGVSELWQVFFANNQVLEKTRVDDHPYCVVVPVPMPHRAIGTCPAEQVADLQLLKSTLVRQMLNNVYSTNFNRIVANERVDWDSLLTPVPGGVVAAEGHGSVHDSVMVLPTSNQVPGILQAIEYSDTMREVRTGVTRYNQGMDTESLNKTATGFQGIRDMSQLRIELIARVFAGGGVRRIFEKIAETLAKYQDEAMQIKVSGQPLEVDPQTWKYKTNCSVDVGLGSGDRQEKIANLNYIISQQKELMLNGSSLADQKKLFNAFDKIITEIGLKEVSIYFNDPEKPEELLQAENEQLKGMIQQLQAQVNNPLAEAEAIKQSATTEREILKIQTKAQVDGIKLDQDDRHHDDEMAIKLADIESRIKQVEAQTGRDINEDEVLYTYDVYSGNLTREA